MLTQAQQEQAENLRTWIEQQLTSDERFSEHARGDRSDGSTLATRWQTAENPHVWIELAIRPLIPQIRVGIVTDDRWKSEDFEEKIQESGDTMSEFVEMGFEDAGLEWEEPLVEHYRAESKYFYFSTPLETVSLDDFTDEELRTKVMRMIDGYYHAFGPYLAD